MGALLGDVFLHILPELWESGHSSPAVMSLIFVGFLLFFILEKFLRWHHGHEGEVHSDTIELEQSNHTHHIGYLNLISDGLHNFIDGVVIAGAYLVSVEIGTATTLAVILHEIPQEIGDFGLLLHAGFSRARALFYNFLSAVFAIFGVLAVVLLGDLVTGLEAYILAIAAGGFLYIAAADLVPELHKTSDLRKSFIQLLAILMGFVLMALLLTLE